MFEFTMPALGADMDYGTVVEWYVQPGDVVDKGDSICAVETQKGAMDVEIWEPGVVREFKVALNEKLPVGAVLMLLEAPGQAPSPAPESIAPASQAPATAEATPVEDAAIVAGVPVEDVAAAGRVVASPAARNLARQAGLSLEELHGSGPGGAIVLSDVLREKDSAALKTRREDGEAPQGQAPHVPEHHHRVSPLARRVAAEKHVDLERVQGTGPHEAITREDVERAAGMAAADAGEATTAASAADEGGATTAASAADGGGVTARTSAPAREVSRAAGGGMREVIAAAMARSKRTIPHYYLEASIDMEPALAFIQDQNADRSPAERLLPAALLIRAVARAAQEHPRFNGYYRDDGFAPSEQVHLGFIIALRGGGVVAPAILEAQSKDVDQSMQSLRDVVARARRGKLRAAEMSQGTITVTSLGELGVSKVYGVIYPPQVAIVGFGSIEERSWAQDGMVGARRCLTVTLAADHRVSDGMAGAKFLSTIQDALQHPETL